MAPAKKKAEQDRPARTENGANLEFKEARCSHLQAKAKQHTIGKLIDEAKLPKIPFGCGGHPDPAACDQVMRLAMARK